MMVSSERMQELNDIQYEMLYQSIKAGEQVPAGLQSTPGYLEFVERKYPIMQLNGNDTDERIYADMFVKEHTNNVLYAHDEKAWYRWDGSRFKRDVDGGIGRDATDTIRSFYEAASKVAGDDQHAKELRAKYIKLGQKNDTHKNRTAMLATASEYADIAITSDKFDQDPFLLNCPNGTIDLRTGEIAPNNKGNRLSKSTNTYYYPEAKHDTFDRYFDEITGGNQEIKDYIQKSVGYTMTGSTKEQCLFFLYGEGSNGKSTFIETIASVLDEYAYATKPETFVKSSFSGDYKDDGNWKGKRMVFSTETAEGSVWDNSFIKRMTGSDTVSSERKYENATNWKAQFKIWISGNHKPVVKDLSDGMWRRLRLIPFMVKIEEDKKDLDLPKKLEAEKSGILNWMIEGCKKYHAEGLKTPQLVANSVKEYRTESDIIQLWITERCTTALSGISEFNSILYNDYKNFCDDNGEQPVGKKAFPIQLAKKGYIRDDSNNKGARWVGIKLKGVNLNG